MGSPATDEKRGDNELLSHKVQVSDFGWENMKSLGMNMNCG